MNSLATAKTSGPALMLIAIGAAAMFIARNYPFGTALRMGPGYFPIVLGALLILFGLYHPGVGPAHGASRSKAPGRCARSSSCRSRSFCSAC